MKEKQLYVYIVTNILKTVLYTGVTSNFKQRVYQHKEGMLPGFTKRYKTTRLVYYEVAQNAYSAITREKQLKSGSRQDKLDLIKEFNPAWDDLYYCI